MLNLSRCTRSFSFPGVLLWGIFLCLVSQVSEGAPQISGTSLPVEPQRFAADPSALLNASRSYAPVKDANQDTLYARRFVRIEKDGRRTHKYYSVLRYLTHTAIQDQGIISENWSPWLEARPQIRLRVISPTGEIIPMPQESIVDSRVGRTSTNVFTDDRVLEAPIPGLQPGCLVEYETTRVEKQTFCDAGVAERFLAISLTHTHNFKYTVEHPNDLALQILTHDVVQPVKTVGEKSTRITWDIGSLAPTDFKKLEMHVPADVQQIPKIVSCTGKSWGDIARYYGSLLQSTESERVNDLVREITSTNKSSDTQDVRLQTISQCMEYLRSNVRYTGLAFGAQSIVPRKPDDTLLSRFGDCKDQSTLLKSMLNAAGIDAEIALVNTYGLRSRKETPGLDSFNHAIVYVPGEPALWIDPTQEFQRVGQLPFGLAGDLALVANSDGLTRIPAGVSTDNRIEIAYDIKLTKANETSMASTYTYYGGAESVARSSYEGVSQKDLNAAFTEDAESYRGTLVSARFTRPRDFSQPFQVTAQFNGMKWGHFSQQGVDIGITPVDDIVRRLPAAMLENIDDEKASPLRTHPLHMDNIYQVKISYRLNVPPGTELITEPTPISRRFGPISFRRQVEVSYDTVELVYTLDTGDGKLSPLNVSDFRAFLRRQTEGENGWVDALGFGTARSRLARMESDSPDAKLRKLRQAVLAEPNDPQLHSLYAQQLAKIGMIDAARKEMNRALELLERKPQDPFRVNIYAAASIVFRYGDFGIDMGEGWDREKVLKYLRLAQKFGGPNALMWEIGGVQTINNRGWGFDDAAELSEGIATLEQANMYSPDPKGKKTLLYLWLLSSRTEKLLTTQVLTAHPDMAVAAVALKQGTVAAANFTNQRVKQSDREIVIRLAGRALLRIGRPDLAANLIGKFPAAVKDAEFIKSVNKITLARFFPKDKSAELKLIREYLTALFLGERQKQKSLLANAPGIETQQAMRFVATDRRRTHADNFNERQAADMLYSLDFKRTMTLNGLVTAYEVSFNDIAATEFVVANINGKLQIVGQDRDGGHWGFIAANLAQYGHVHAASVCLNNVTDTAPNSFNTLYNGTPFEDFRATFPAGQAFKTPSVIQTASALLTATAMKADQNVIVQLQNAIPRHQKPAQKLAIERALALAYVSNNDPRAVPLAEKLFEQHSSADEALRTLLKSLLQAERFDRLEELAKTRTKLSHIDIAREFQGWLHLRKGKIDQAAKLFPQSEDRIRDYDAVLAWANMYSKPTNVNSWTDVLFGVAQAQSRGMVPSSQLAAAYGAAEQGNDFKARYVCDQIYWSLTEPEKYKDEYFLILGRRAESLQLPEVALMYYSQVSGNHGPQAVILSKLAQDRISSLRRTAMRPEQVR